MSHIEDYIDSKKEEIIKEVCEIVKIPSVNEISTDTNKPFGENVNKALEHFLKLGERLGFRTKNIDGYCGYVEFGEGKEMLGIIGHLDVVPVGDGWSYLPFDPVIADGKLYGRGSTDDKGPVIAALYAMKAVKELCKVNKRVRLIVGLNEENDWKCIEHYKKVEEMPTLGFSPDADFPCIYAEKGLLSVYISKKIEENEDTEASLYIAITNKIVIANISNTFTRIQTIAHECLHSIQNRKILLFNFIYSNIYMLYFIIISVLAMCKVLPYKMMFLSILITGGFLYYLVRSYLENDAMIKARFLAKEYMEKKKISSQEEINRMINTFDKLNDIGIKGTNYALCFSVIIEILIFCIICMIR